MALVPPVRSPKELSDMIQSRNMAGRTPCEQEAHDADVAGWWHFCISMGKSVLRCAGFVILACYIPPVGLILLAAEVLGILEELVLL